MSQSLCSAELEDALRSVTFRPYSDFLLHDMGDMEADGIGDGIPEGDAGPFEMRTPPLWNLRDRSVMLHDGSAGEFDFAERGAQVVLTYRSPRGLCHLAEGLALGAAAVFDEKVTVEQETCRHRGDTMCRVVVDYQVDD